MIRTTKIETPLGEMLAASTAEGICLLEFSDKNRSAKELASLSATLNYPVRRGTNRHLRSLNRQLKEYFKGSRKEFSLSLVTPGTSFQLRVWNSLREIPYGLTISYIEQAKLIGDTKAVRAVANANSTNRIAIIIPCHRVIGSDGDLVGYGGGLERKRWLIDHEKRISGQPFDGTLF